MTIPNVTAGADVVESWGDAVADMLNRFQVKITTSDVSKTGTTFTDITGLTGTVVNGKNYLVRATVVWDQSSTSGGIRIAMNFPTGNIRALARYTGETSDTSVTEQWHTVADDGAGVATADTTGAKICIIQGRYICQADGTFALRYRANTTGTAKIQAGAVLELIADS